MAIDDVGGMMFNNRRQSQDRYLREYLLEKFANNRIWISEYTAKQFEQPLPNNIVVDNELLDKAEQEDICFIEGLYLNNYEKKINQLILFKWNRIYPSDMKLDIDLNKWRLIESEEFAGYSHEKVTKEVWTNEAS